MELQPAATYRSEHGMVCSIDHLASQAGLAMLRAGGSAADAIIATNAVLTVTTQHLCGLGGDLLAVIVPPGEAPIVLNATGHAGSGADAERLRSEGHRAMPFRGHIAAVTVPGCVDAWMALHARFGRLPLEEVLAPAERYATEGFPASPSLAEDFAPVAELPEAADFLASGPLRPGTRIQRPGVGRTLRAIASEGRRGFYEGEFGEGLIALGDGQFSEADLTRPISRWIGALSIDAWGARLWSAPPNSQGYLALASAWIASGLDLPTDPADPGWAHLLIEAARQAGYDRLDVLSDHADGKALLDEAELMARRAAIDPARTADIGAPQHDGDTCALLAVDADRLAVSMLQSNAAGFGAHIVVPGVRIFLHNRGIGFSLEPGHANEYGPGRRPVSTLSPVAVTSPSGDLRGVLASMGGDSQPQILLQLLARIWSNDQSPGDALAAGRFTLSDPDGGSSFDTWRTRGRVDVQIEGHTPPGWAEGLAQRGHTVRVGAPYSRAFGHAHAILADDDFLIGGTDPRPRSGAVAAY